MSEMQPPTPASLAIKKPSVSLTKKPHAKESLSLRKEEPKSVPPPSSDSFKDSSAKKEPSNPFNASVEKSSSAAPRNAPKAVKEATADGAGLSSNPQVEKKSASTKPSQEPKKPIALAKLSVGALTPKKLPSPSIVKPSISPPDTTGPPQQLLDASKEKKVETKADVPKGFPVSPKDSLLSTKPANIGSSAKSLEPSVKKSIVLPKAESKDTTSKSGDKATSSLLLGKIRPQADSPRLKEIALHDTVQRAKSKDVQKEPAKESTERKKPPPPTEDKEAKHRLLKNGGKAGQQTNPPTTPPALGAPPKEAESTSSNAPALIPKIIDNGPPKLSETIAADVSKVTLPKTSNNIMLERETKYNVAASVQRENDDVTNPPALIHGVVESLDIASGTHRTLRSLTEGVHPTYYAEPCPRTQTYYDAYHLPTGAFVGNVPPPAQKMWAPLPHPASPLPKRESMALQTRQHWPRQVSYPFISPPYMCPTCGTNPLIARTEYSSYRLLPDPSLAHELHPREQERIPRDRSFRRKRPSQPTTQDLGRQSIRYLRPTEFKPEFREPGAYEPNRKIGRTAWRSPERHLNIARSPPPAPPEASYADSDVSSGPPTPRSYYFGPEYCTTPWRKEYRSNMERQKARAKHSEPPTPLRRPGVGLRGRPYYQGGLTTYRRLGELATYYTNLEVEDQSDVISLLLSCRKLEKQIEEQHVMIDMLDHDLRQAQETLRFPPEWQQFKDIDLAGVPPADVAKIPDGQLPLYVKGRVLLQQREPPPGATYILEPDMARAIQVKQVPPGKQLELQPPPKATSLAPKTLGGKEPTKTGGNVSKPGLAKTPSKPASKLHAPPSQTEPSSMSPASQPAVPDSQPQEKLGKAAPKPGATQPAPPVQKELPAINITTTEGRKGVAQQSKEPMKAAGETVQSSKFPVTTAATEKSLGEKATPAKPSAAKGGGPPTKKGAPLGKPAPPLKK